MRIHTSIVTAAVTLALAGPAVAGAATMQRHSVVPTVVSTVYLGTSSVPGSCTLTMTAGHVSSFRCPGSLRHADPGSCTLTVAAGRLWTYSCPGGSGVSRGAIPPSCRAIDESGYRWTFSCPRGAFNGSTLTGSAPVVAKKKPSSAAAALAPVPQGTAFGGSKGPYIGTLTPRSTGQSGTTVATSLPCTKAVIDGYVTADRCAA